MLTLIQVTTLQQSYQPSALGH